MMEKVALLITKQCTTLIFIKPWDQPLNMIPIGLYLGPVKQYAYVRIVNEKLGRLYIPTKWQFHGPCAMCAFSKDKPRV